MAYLNGWKHTQDELLRELGLFLEAPGNYPACCTFLFCVPDGSFKRFENCTVKLLAKETKWTSLEARTHPTFLEHLISKSDSGPVKLPGLLRNWPQDTNFELRHQMTYMQLVSSLSQIFVMQFFVNYSHLLIFCHCFKSLQSAAHFSLGDQFKNDCYFFDALCRQNDLQDIFRSKVQLYPPDLVKNTSGLEHKK